MTMTLDEVIALLKEPPSTERTLLYIENRGCWDYRPYRGQNIDDLPPHMKDLQRSCFNCGHQEPEYAGTCWGNMSCEIWVCANCAPQVQEAKNERRAVQSDNRESGAERQD